MFAQFSSIDQKMAEPLNEILECWRFWTRDYWSLFTDDARSTSSWREQNHILIRHLYAHYDRLSLYSWGPSQAWLVAWAISHADTPLQEFLSWSLHSLVPNEVDVTIQTFAEHLELWADLFESRKIHLFRVAVADDDSSFLYNQHAVGSPWIAHFLISKPEYWQYTCQMWEKLCRQRLESLNAACTPCLRQPLCTCAHPAANYQVTGPEILRDHLDSREKATTASEALDYILSCYEKQRNNNKTNDNNDFPNLKTREHKKKKSKNGKVSPAVVEPGRFRSHMAKFQTGKISPVVVKPGRFLNHMAKFQTGKKIPFSKKKRSR
ncbi:hypothetical protein PV08_06244 [Exophiala spinifera]|uniref:Uncharacterized protein n=1 Tax=Exophiala spinifera TaxID=91928 RepID=A0A0D2BB16_9EURO|nr:uncharacterized protein PV08_06244 [Exophiala spinifera]KIW16193.1 hypothetical protein PV08_06244 [Exophiala spinifera]